MPDETKNHQKKCVMIRLAEQKGGAEVAEKSKKVDAENRSGFHDCGNCHIIHVCLSTHQP